jgi:hypothetical protein
MKRYQDSFFGEAKVNLPPGFDMNCMNKRKAKGQSKGQKCFRGMWNTLADVVFGIYDRI